VLGGDMGRCGEMWARCGGDWAELDLCYWEACGGSASIYGRRDVVTFKGPHAIGTANRARVNMSVRVRVCSLRVRACVC